MKKFFIYFLLLSIPLYMSGCQPGHVSQSNKDIRYSISKISNDDIGWNFSPAVTLPEVYGKNANNILRYLPDNEIRLLFSCLNDKNKYVAAHVLLTIITETGWSGDANDDRTWNHLKINVVGTYEYHDDIGGLTLTRYKCDYAPENQNKVIEYWNEQIKLHGKLMRGSGSSVKLIFFDPPEGEGVQPVQEPESPTAVGVQPVQQPQNDLKE